MEQDRGPPQPSSGGKQKRKRSRKSGAGRQFQRADQALGFFGPSVPSLHDLQRENRKRTRRHYSRPNGQYQQYRQNNRGRPTFKSAPPAPSPGVFPGAGNFNNPLETPTVPAAAALANSQDKLEAEGLAADLDFFGTNEGLVFYREDEGEEDHSSDGDDADGRSHSRSHSERSESESEGEGGGGGDLHRRIVQRLRERVLQQDLYIAQLEDETLNLRERLDLQRQELEELRPAAVRRCGAGQALSAAAGLGAEADLASPEHSVAVETHPEASAAAPPPG